MVLSQLSLLPNDEKVKEEICVRTVSDFLGIELELVPSCSKIRQVQVSNFNWNCPSQIVVAEIKPCQCCQATQFSWNWSSQRVAMQMKIFQCCQATQFSWNWSSQRVVTQIKCGQCCQATQFSWK